MANNLANDVKVYKDTLNNISTLQATYCKLMHFVRQLATDFQKMDSDYVVGNISPGYMDFTYFPFSNDLLQQNKLRFGIVLNHKAMSFELWLMGRNATVQKQYWDLLKSSIYNKHLITMPKYSVLEVILDASPDFANLNELSENILNKAIAKAKEIELLIK